MDSGPRPLGRGLLIRPGGTAPVQVTLPLPPGGLPLTWLAVLAGRCRVP